jgi:hypothetical protein
MTDEFSLRRATDDMAKADALLRNETLIKTLDGLKASYTAAWKATEARDTQGREICWSMLKAAEGFEDDLRRAITDGKIALHELAAIDKQREGAA